MVAPEEGMIGVGAQEWLFGERVKGFDVGWKGTVPDSVSGSLGQDLEVGWVRSHGHTVAEREEVYKLTKGYVKSKFCYFGKGASAVL